MIAPFYDGAIHVIITKSFAKLVVGADGVVGGRATSIETGVE